MNTTADLMHTIHHRVAYLAILDERLRQSRRLSVLAEVTHGMASPEFRRHRLDMRQANVAIGQITYDLNFAREQLARLCEPWFRMEVYP